MKDSLRKFKMRTDAETEKRCFIKTFLAKSKNILTLHLSVLVYVVIMIYLTFLRYYSFSSSAWDLGIFNQACYTTLHGKIFYYTAELYANPGGCVLGAHFSPILFAVIPFYAIYPSPESLLTIQTIVLAIGAYPVFLIAKKVLKSENIALLFSILYLAYPHLHSVNIFDFHPDAFFVLFTLFAYLFFIEERWKSYFLFVTLALLTKEFMSILILFFAIGELIPQRREIVNSLRMKKLPSKKCLVLICTLLLAIGYFALAKYLLLVFNPHKPPEYIEGAPWKILGIDPLDPSSYTALYKANIFGAVSYDFKSKVFYLLTILVPFAFLPIFKPLKFLPAIIWIVIAFLSNYLPYYSLWLHYSAMIVPFTVIASIEGARKFNLMRVEDMFNSLRKVLLIGSILGLIVAFVMVPRSIFMISEHDRKVMQTIEWILSKDPDASILTQHDIFPYVSNRVNSYVIPDLFVRFQKDFYFRYVRSLFNQGIDYVILDLNPDFRTDAHFRTYSAAFKFIEENYGLYASVDGVLVYKWHYNGPLVKFEPFTIHDELEKLENSEIVYDTVLFRCALPKGEYNVTLNVEVSKIIEGKVFSVMVTQGKNVLTSLDVYGSDLKNMSKVSFSFNILSSRQDVVIHMVDISPYTQVYVKSLDISLLEHFR
nr:DUF2079 domain-containing protein [Candidatus Baldrarchaeota archaeon]